MPTYDYACGDCGGFDAFRPLAARNEPAACPGCGAASPRVLVTAPGLACVGADTRRANEVNERSAHAPSSSGAYGRLRHPSGCGCCSAGKRSGADGAMKSFAGRRPWMISH